MEYSVNLLVIFILILLILLLILLYLLWRRRKDGNDGTIRKIPVVPGRKQRLPRYNPNEELIFFLDKNKTSKEQFIAELLKTFSFPSGGPKFNYPCPCTDAVFTVEGITPLVSGSPDPTQPPTGGGQTPPFSPSGSFGGALYCPNYYFDLPYKVNGEFLPPPTYPGTLPGAEGKQILVAVLDTGLDPNIAKLYKPKVETSCVDAGSEGYNFISNTSDTTDDFGADHDPCNPAPSGHGTPVTGLILQMAAKVKIKILPVKCLDKDGHATLIQVMCALAYAKKAGANIINLSLGFYSPLSEYVELFRKFLVDHVTKDNTIVVAAAGNINTEEDKQAMAAPEHIAEKDLRNLDKHLFFPAAFSKDNENIIAVTTISRQTRFEPENFTVCPRQNYSTSKVQVGVAADVDCYRFLDAFAPNNNNPGQRGTWIGSSFATPVVSGLLAATYHQFLTEGKVYSRDEYFTWLKDNRGNVFKDKASMSLPPNDNLPEWLLLRGTEEQQMIDVSNPVIRTTKPEPETSTKP